MLLRKGLEGAAQDVIKALGGMSEDIQGKKSRVAEVATISAGDAQIGDLIADVIDKVGRDGVVTVEEGQGLELESEVVEGFTFDRGFVSPYMVTDTARMEAVYDQTRLSSLPTRKSRAYRSSYRCSRSWRRPARKTW